MIIWRGQSKATGASIAVHLTNVSGIQRRSKNTKIGDMAQAWILPASQNPYTATKTGLDKSVCFSCSHRPEVAQTEGAASCYVTTHRAPLAIYKSAKGSRTVHVETLRDHLHQLPLRIGAYGDPAAVPVHVWRTLLSYVPGHTSYTQQWQSQPYLRRVAMASTTTPADTRKAWRKGWRTFRTKAANEPVLQGEIVCPASKEAGHKTTCSQCLLCDGAVGRYDRRKSIVIDRH
jgi:hypothetical protein